MKIIVDRAACIGAASCVAIAMKTFQLDQDGKAEVFNDKDHVQNELESSGFSTDSNDLRDVMIEAARSCPTNAIRVLEDDGTPIV